MVICNDTNCPKCGSSLKYYNTVQRIVKKEGGVTQRIKIRRLICSKCGSIHRELPSYLVPYKHYTLEIIRGVIEGEITPFDLDYEDYPCEITMKRWKESQEIQPLLRNKSEILKRGKDHMHKKDTVICPDCGGVSIFYDHVGRTVRSEYGKVDRIKIKRYKCINCGKIHRKLPDFLMPHKQFKTDIIKGFVSDSLNIEDLKYENYPSDQTIKHWKKEFNKD